MKLNALRGTGFGKQQLKIQPGEGKTIMLYHLWRDSKAQPHMIRLTHSEAKQLITELNSQIGK